jgi:hypothetical protein
VIVPSPFVPSIFSRAAEDGHRGWHLLPTMGVVSNLMTLVLILIAGLMERAELFLPLRQHTPSLAWDLIAPVICCCFTLSQFLVESRCHSRVCCFRRLPPIPHGSANRRSRTHSGMARAGCGCHFGVVAQLVVGHDEPIVTRLEYACFQANPDVKWSRSLQLQRSTSISSREVKTACSRRGIVPLTRQRSHREGHMPVNIGRRELIAALCSAVTWPLAARVQPGREQRIGVIGTV